MGRLGEIFLKYIEELSTGETFKYNDQFWLLTSDFKSSGKRLCHNMQNGNAKWFDGNEMVEFVPLYSLDKDNNIIPIRKYANENSNIR
jgi:hypothetical protein